MFIQVVRAEDDGEDIDGQDISAADEFTAKREAQRLARNQRMRFNRTFEGCLPNSIKLSLNLLGLRIDAYTCICVLVCTVYIYPLRWW